MENKQKYPCIETTLDFEYGNSVIRLWLNETSVTQKTYPEIPEIIRHDLFGHYFTNEEIISILLSKIPNINAIQIKEKAKDEISWGTVVYTVDFSEDVHG